MARTIAGRPDTVYGASEGDKFNTDTTLAVVSCPTCGIAYAIPEKLNRSALKWPGDRPGGWKLCCPLGHTWWYVGAGVCPCCNRTFKNLARHMAGQHPGFTEGDG